VGVVRDSKLKTWLVVLFAALLPCIAGAAGLGRMNVLTNIGQPLVAEIDLSVTREELGSLSARLAQPDAYLRANLQYNPALTGALLTIESRAGGQSYLKLVTKRPVTEPFIDVLVELTWSSGRLSREYTALLDPPGIPPMARSAAPVTATMPESAPAPAPAVPVRQAAVAAETQPRLEAPVAAAPSLEPAPSPAPEIAAPIASTPVPTPVAIGREYGPIERGETLGKIARATMPEGVTLEQMLVALYRTNEEAFIRKNLNLVRTGKILRVPDRDEVTAIAQGDAVAEYRTHVADWNAYRQRLAEAAGAAPTEGRTAVSGKIATKIEDPASGAAPRDVVKVSQGEPPGAAGKGKPRSTAERIRTLEEDLMAREKALAEANERIAQLEKTVKDMQKLIELKGGPGVSAAAKPGAKPAPKPAPAKPEAVAAAKPEPPKPFAAKPEVAKPAPTPTPMQQPAAAAPEAKKPEQVAAKAPSPAPKPKPKAAPPPPKPEPGLVDEIMAAVGDPLYLGAGGGVIVLGGLAFWMARRRRSRAAEGESPPIAPTLSEAAAAAAGAAAGTGDTAAAPAASAAAASEEDVDPLAEADVYIQYGRDSQAEEILKEALNRDPRRPEVHLKLLEIYAARKDKGAFGKIAGDYHKLTGGAGEGWLKAAAMGYGLDSGNPLYEAGKDSVATVAPGPSVGSSTDVDLDLGGAAGTATDITLDAGAAGAAGTDTGILDIGASDAAQKEGDQAGTPLPDFTLEVPAAGDSTPADVALEPPTPATAQAPESNIIDFQIELPRIEAAPTTIARPAEAAADPGLEFKLEIPDLDLGDKGHDKTQVLPAAGAEKDGHWYDVQTKFDLAKAYQEMGDKDGAKEILQEVIKEGDAEQKSQAQTLLDSLG
jgi:pilus assembly protein FimV